jgi:hypothetical protein
MNSYLTDMLLTSPPGPGAKTKPHRQPNPPPTPKPTVSFQHFVQHIEKKVESESKGTRAAGVRGHLALREQYLVRGGMLSIVPMLRETAAIGAGAGAGFWGGAGCGREDQVMLAIQQPGDGPACFVLAIDRQYKVGPLFATHAEAEKFISGLGTGLCFVDTVKGPSPKAVAAYLSNALPVMRRGWNAYITPKTSAPAAPAN